MRKALPQGQYALLSAIQNDPPKAYGAGLYTTLEENGRELAFGSIYTMLDRMVAEGLVTAHWGDATPERGGRRKRIYTITAKGQQALRDTEAAYRPPAEKRGPASVAPGLVGGPAAPAQEQAGHGHRSGETRRGADR